MKFSEIEQGSSSEMNGASINGLGSLKSFSRLESLTLVVYEDILTSDLNHLRTIRDSVSGICRITVDVRKASLYYEHGGWDVRQVRISSDAARKMQQWDWAMKGEWELVDRRHRLRREEAWLAWLRRNNQWGVKSGLLEEPRGFFEKCIFYM